MQNIQGKMGKKGKAFAALFLVAVLAIGLFVFINTDRKSLPDGAVLSFQGIPDNNPMESLLQTSAGSIALTQKKHSFFNADSFAPPYKISATVKTGKDDYHDVLFTVDKDRGTLTVATDGFALNDRLSLNLDDDIIFDSIPMDWSGRLELKAALKDAAPTKACIKIEGGEHPIGACHIVPKGRKS